MKISIDLLLNGAKQVTSGLAEVKQSVTGIGTAFRDGVATGMAQAVQDIQKPLAQVDKLVDASAAGVKQSAGTIGQAWRDGVVGGMEQAVRELNRPVEDLRKVADDARKVLSIRPDIEIEEEIRKTKQAYEDLKTSGLATTGELGRAKDAMKAKIAELRGEMKLWDGDWKALGKTIGDIGSKMQGLGARAMVAGAPAILAGKANIEAEHNLVGIANTAGVDPVKAAATAAEWKRQINEIAHLTNQAQDDLVQAMGVLVSKGLDPDKAIAMLRPVGNAATATGGQIADIARTLYSTYDNLKAPIAEAGRTLDVLATAGNRGAFELKDMSQYFPQMSAAAGMLKMQGVEASASLAAAAQIAMKGTGEASAAANNLNNFLLKLTAPDTMKNFADVGVDLSKEIKKGLESGDLIGYMAELINKVTGGNAEELSKLFGDQQVKMFLAPMLANIEEYRSIRDEALKAVGTIDAQKAAILTTTQEKLKGINIDFNKALDDATMFQAVLDKVKGVAEWFQANPDVFGPIATVVSALAVGGAGLVVAGTALSAVGSGLAVIGAAWTSGLLAAALPVVAGFIGAVAAWKVGQAFGDWIAEQINKMVQAMTGDEFATLGTALFDLVENIQAIPDKLAATWADWKAAGSNLVQALRDGITAKLQGVLGIGEKITDAIAYIKDTASKWLQVGKDIIQGLIDGIKAKAQEVWDAVKGLGKKAIDTINQILDRHSPSKVFYAVGQDVGEGMRLGILGKVNDVHDAAKKLGVSAIYGVKDRLSADWLLGQLKDYEELVAELEKDNTKAEAARQKAIDGMIEEGKRLTESLRDDMDVAFDLMERYQDLLDAGAITWDTYAKAVAKATLAVKDNGGATGALGSAIPNTVATAQDAANSVAAEWTRAGNDMATSITDALMRGFEDGKSFARNALDTLENWFNTTILRPIIQPVGQMGANAVLGLLGMGGAGAAQASPIGAAASGFMQSMGGSLLGGIGTSVASGMFSMFGGAGAMQASMLAAQTAGFGMAGTASTLSALGGMGSVAGALMSALPYIGAIVALVSMFGTGGTPHLGSTRTFDMEGGNSLVTRADWTAAGGNATGTPGWLYTEGASSPYDDALQAAGQTLVQTIATNMEALGGTLSDSFRFNLGFAAENEAETASGGLAQVSVGGESVLDLYKRYAKDGKAGMEAFLAEAMPRIELAAYQAADGLNPAIEAVVDLIDAGTASMDAVSGVLKIVSDYGPVLEAMEAYAGADLMADAMDQIEKAGRSAWETWQAGTADLRNMASTYDGTLVQAQQIAAATQTQYQMELQLIGQIQGMLASTAAMFGDSIRTIQLDMLDVPGQYDFIRTEIDGLFAQLTAATDPALISDLSARINTLAMQAWGLLDDEQQGTNGQYWIDYLNTVNTVTTGALEDAKDTIEETHTNLATDIKGVMDAVADRMMEAATKFETAANTSQAAAETPVDVRGSVTVTVDRDGNLQGYEVGLYNPNNEG